MYYDGNWDDPFVLVGDVDTEVRQWHAHQLKREDTLRRIETDTIDELSDFWKQHEKKRTQLIEDHVSGLSVLFLSKGYKIIITKLMQIQNLHTWSLHDVNWIRNAITRVWQNTEGACSE